MDYSFNDKFFLESVAIQRGLNWVQIFTKFSKIFANIKIFFFFYRSIIYFKRYIYSQIYIPFLKVFSNNSLKKEIKSVIYVKES